MISSSHNPVHVVESDDWRSVYHAFLNERDLQRPLIVTSAGMSSRLKFEEVFGAGMIIKTAPPNPTLAQTQNLISSCRDADVETVIALGGGSVMDMAKVIVATKSTGCVSANSLFQIAEPFDHRLPLVCVPTTHGSGSEVTSWATIWDPPRGKKYSFANEALYPDLAILDGSLAMALPIELSVITGLDALTHAFEAIWNRNRNPTSTEFALESISLFLKYLPRLKEDPACLTTRTTLLKAANLAGLAFSRTKTAAAHSISYPLTLGFGIPHGLASFLSLLPVLQITRSEIENELRALCLKLSVPTIKDLTGAIADLPKPFLKTRLREWGVTSSSLGKIVDEAFTPGRMENSVVPLGRNDVLAILEEIL